MWFKYILYDHWIFHVLGSNNKMRIVARKKLIIFHNQKAFESLQCIGDTMQKNGKLRITRFKVSFCHLNKWTVCEQHYKDV